MQDDETLVTQLNDALQERYENFLYSKRQQELAGADGEKVFNEVFGERARAVVVVYRDTWGTTPWTRIEETAIRIGASAKATTSACSCLSASRRGLRSGYRRTAYGITTGALDSKRRLPSLTHISNTKRELDVLSSRFSKPMARLDRALQQQGRREVFLHSYEGVGLATTAYREILTRLENWAASDEAKRVGVAYKRNDLAFVLLHSGGRIAAVTSLDIVWRRTYANDLKDDFVQVAIWDGHPPFPGTFLFDKPQQKTSWKFEFDLSGTNEVVFVERSGEGRTLSIEGFVEEIVRRYTTAIHKAQVKRQ